MLAHNRAHAEAAAATPVATLPFGEEGALGHFRDSREVISHLSPDFPLYCFSPRELKRRVNEFQVGFPGDVGFAVKSNAAEIVLRAVAAAGVKVFDVASLDEIRRIRAIAPAAEILYDNPVKSPAEIREAYELHGVRSFAIDDSEEFDKLRAIVGADPQVQISVRFKLPGSHAVHNLSRKFGATEPEAIMLLRRVALAGYQPALTFHPGSQCTNPLAYAEHITAAARIRQKAAVSINMLNVGGGFPAPYLDEAVPPLSAFFRAIDSAYRANFIRSECRLVCEPGRALVATSASLLCQVKHRRRGHTLFLNDGIYGGFMEQFVTAMTLPNRAFRGTEPLRGPTAEFEVFGPTCDSTDRFTLPLRLPEDIAQGDWIEFGLMGAYGSVTSTRFNGFSSDRYVLVDNGF